MPFQIESPAFVQESAIPTLFTCEGENISPPLQWSSPPKGTKSFALICDDPDAPVGTWVHWVIYHIPPEKNELSESIAPLEEVQGMRQGLNDFQRVGYGGPCPPKGAPHRYFFKLYALDTLLALHPKATKKELEKAMQGHILAETHLIGTYKR